MKKNTLQLSSLIQPGEPAVKAFSSRHMQVAHHDHDFYELVYVTEGYCLSKMDGHSSLLMEGDCFIVPPGVSHAYAGNRVTRIYNVIFDESALTPYLPQLQQLPGLTALFDADRTREIPRLRLTLSQRKTFLRWISSMAELSEHQQLGWQVRLPCELACLLVEFARVCCVRADGQAGEDPYPAYVRQALCVIEANYTDCNLTVQQIAVQVGVSADHLTRQFKQVTGLSTQEYLRRYRFARAMSLLQTDCPIAQVASSAGFRTLSYFSREFTRELGISPSKYKKSNQSYI